MQTFLPFEDFEDSARCLDMRRLGKQRVEAWQIWLTLTVGSRWKSHPAVKMWDAHRWWLLLYGISVCEEWRSRGYRDTLLVKFLDEIEKLEPGPYPDWLGLEKLHSSHRANLIRKDAKYYKGLGWTEVPQVGYYWPTKGDG